MTGVKGKTSVCYLVSKILHDAGRSVLLHSSRGEGPWTDEGHRIDRKVSIAPPYLMTLPAGRFDVIVSEVSLGGSGKADIAMVTNLAEDYGIAKNTFKASDAKKDIFTDGINIVPEDELEQVIRFVEGLDIREIAEQVMQKLFKALAMRYEFSLTGLTEPVKK